MTTNDKATQQQHFKKQQCEQVKNTTYNSKPQQQQLCQKQINAYALCVS